MSESRAMNNDHWRELEEWRGKIDEIDRQVAALLCQRLQFAGNISSVKSRMGETVLQPEREKEVLINVLTHTDSPAMSQALERIYHSILNESRLFQQECKDGQQNHSSQ
ncbi:chorismate mutase [Chlorobaculum sp. MV4-Y]|uniref:chorismate mutase n=1 Tax=Chlorobaculum sp. MV4-Y TaxID=2976335 RepID=UPI0021AF89A4|nr:chorismate mutase [Chlorobaculum sp. MV4-Y]UWX57581.1 chorismate mutase [Chlorobaculum sp. MV4-Y]